MIHETPHSCATLLSKEQEHSFSYTEEQILFPHTAAGITLAGTLTLPQGVKSRSTVILIAGYGKNDRDYTMMGHRPFAVIADYLARQGIAVFRFDKRGVGSSEGDYHSATSEDFAQDVHAAVDYLSKRQDSNGSSLGLIGFSEGGLLATMVAADCLSVAYTILMAPALVNDTTVLIKQMGNQLRADGASESFIESDAAVRAAVYTIIKTESEPEAQNKLQAVFADYWSSLSEIHKAESRRLLFAFTEEKAPLLISVFNGPWYRFFVRYDARPLLARVTVPTLVLTGERDCIVSSTELAAFVERHGKSQGALNYSVVEIPEANHSFQTCNTGALSEYATNQEAISPAVLSLLAEWIRKR